MEMREKEQRDMKSRERIISAEDNFNSDRGDRSVW